MHRPEILAPAGTYEAFIAAVHNGCDAVYLGGDKFGARAFAKNFDHAALTRVVQYSKLFDVKIYYTVNTLIKQREILSLLQEINELRNIGIRCFILQDIGVADLLANTFNDIELHASTQMNCHSVYGVRFLETMGMSRVVLSRELSLEEIRIIKSKTSAELETFVHGALCYCYSGQCLMSSFLGGRSGNRGRCAQPCRLKYKTVIDNEVVADNHILSPKDIETLTILPELIESGIDSFKIEGRMKSKEYVGLMTRLYRFYRDQYMEDGQIHIDQQDINDMTQIFNRGEFSNGYYYQHNGPSMITYDQPKNQGITVGQIKGSKGLEVSMTFFEKIRRGDCLEFPLRDGSYHSFIADTDMKGSRTVITRCRSLAVEGAEVRRIKSVALNEKIIEDNNTITQKYIRMHITLKVDQPINLLITDGIRTESVYGDLVQKAEKQGLTAERIEKQFLKVGDYPVMIEDITVESDPDVFMPIGQLNSLRRAGLDRWFHLDEITPEEVILPEVKKSDNTSNHNRSITVLLKNCDQLDAVLCYSVKRVYLEWFNFEREALETMIDRCQDKGIETYLAMPKIVRHENDPMLKLMVDTISDRIDGFLIRSMDSYQFIKEHVADPKIQWDYAMSVMNGYTVDYLMKIEGGSGYCPSLELNRHELRELPLSMAEQVVYGYVNTMTTAQCVRKNTMGCIKEPGKILHLEDRKDVKVPVETVCQLCYNNLYNGVPHYLIDKMPELQAAGIGQFRIDLLDETKEEVTVLMDACRIGPNINSAKPVPAIDKFTRGHYNKGID